MTDELQGLTAVVTGGNRGIGFAISTALAEAGAGVGVVARDQKRAADASRSTYQDRLTEAGYGRITTEIEDAPQFFYAEDYHQQYLAKNPGGYCGHGGTGVTCPVGATV